MKQDIKYRGVKRLLPYNQHEGLGHNTWWNWRVMPYGYKRRNAIIQWLRANKETGMDYIAINKKWCIILKRDPDLKRLLKQDRLWMDKTGKGKCTMSVLRLKG